MVVTACSWSEELVKYRRETCRKSSTVQPLLPMLLYFFVLSAIVGWQVTFSSQGCTATPTTSNLHRQHEAGSSFANCPSTRHSRMSSTQHQPSFEVSNVFQFSEQLEPQSINNDQRCCYPSKRCQNSRVMKRNGELHRLCEYHRTKANVNQRRLEQRRRMRNCDAASAGGLPSQDEERLGSQRLSLPDLSNTETSDLELDVLDEFLSQADIVLSPVNAGSNPYTLGFFDSSTDMRMSI